jgi:hypothetical protein
VAEPGAPGLREVVLIAVVVVVAVLALESISTNVPALRDLFGQFPVTIVVLLVATLGVLLLVLRRPKPG